MTSQFAEALLSDKPNKEIEDQLMLFGQFVGDWDFEWVDGKGTEKERHVKGEWLFAWTLDGKAVQDVFICPSRAERLTNNQPDGSYGTTLRSYNPKTNLWTVCFAEFGRMVILEGKQDGEQIVMNMLNCPDFHKQWVFSDIKDSSFHWEDKTSHDNGKTWIVTGELFATRK